MASDPARRPPIVVLDANLLYPFHLRNLLVQFGVDSIIAPRWTARIHDEWVRNLVRNGGPDHDRLFRTRKLLEQVLPGADTADWERHLPFVPEAIDPKDRHVVAAALASKADGILTFNLRHFPEQASVVPAHHPDDFLLALHDDDPEPVLASAHAAHMNLSRTTPTFPDYLIRLSAQGLPKLAKALAS